MKALYVLSGKLKGQDGGTMIMALMIMAILSIIGISVTNTAVTELQITSNVQVHNMALYDADSGIQFALAHLQNELRNGSTPLPVNFNTPVAFTGTTPSGFSFEISNIALQYDPNDTANSHLPDRILNNRYLFTSAGYAENAYRQAEAVVEATFRQLESQAFQFAGFGDRKMEVKNGGVTKSYDSGSNDPTINDPTSVDFEGTGEADVGSNEDLELKNKAMIGGSAVIGKLEDGTQGVITDLGAIFDPSPGKPDYENLPERVDPDPLGIDSGGIYDPTTYKFNNHNADIGIGTSIDLGNKQTLTLPGRAGGANYYFTDIVLKNGAELIIDDTAGPVNIFIDGGELDFKNGSKVNFEGSALNFAIYSNYESTSNSPAIQLHNGTDFTGTIYAPKANILMNNSGDVYGSMWGRRAFIHNSGVLSYDEALKDKYQVLRNDLRMMSWAEERLL